MYTVCISGRPHMIVISGQDTLLLMRQAKTCWWWWVGGFTGPPFGAVCIPPPILVRHEALLSWTSVYHSYSYRQQWPTHSQCMVRTAQQQPYYSNSFTSKPLQPPNRTATHTHIYIMHTNNKGGRILISLCSRVRNLIG